MTSNQERFMDVYRVKLREAIAQHPELYNPTVSADVIADRMQVAFEKGSYNHDSHAIRATCKELGIKHTRKAIDAYWNGES